MFRILDRYTYRQILPPYSLALLVFTFMLMMGPIDRSARALLARGVSVPVLSKMLLMLVPQALAVTIPMAFLVGLLIAFGRMSADSEWVAAQACGVTLFRMLRPVLVLATLSWGVTQWVLLDAVPWCNQSFREMEYVVVAARVESDIKPRVFFDDFPGLVLYTGGTGEGGSGWSDVLLADSTTPGPPLVFIARNGRMILNRAKRKVDLQLDNVTSYRAKQDPAKGWQYDLNANEHLIRAMDPERVFQNANEVQKGPAEMTVTELRALEGELRQQGQPVDALEVFVHQKFSIPVACLVFALMGLGLGVSSSRGGKLAAFALGVGVIFVYYVVMYMGRALAISAAIPGWLAVWLPNFVLGPAGIAVVLRRARSAGGRGSVLATSAAALLSRLRSVGGGAVGPRSVAGGHPGAPVIVVRFPRLGVPLPGILDRYISRSYLRLQALTFASLLGIFYISTFIDLSDKLFKGKTTAAKMLWYFYFRTPDFIHYVLPLSVLIATLVTIGSLTRNSELIVMKACGVSLYRVALPLIAFGALASLLLFGLQERVLAHTNREAEELEHEIRYGRPRPANLLDRRWMSGRNGDIYHYNLFDPNRGELREFSKYEFDQKNWRLLRITYAASAHYDAAASRRGAEFGVWAARQGWVWEPGRGDKDVQPFPVRNLQIEPPDYFGSERPRSEEMTYGELKQYIAEMRGSGMSVLEPLVGLHQKVSFPFVTIVMTLLAIPFAVSMGRRGALVGIGIGIVLAIVYWMAANLFGLFGGAGMIPPLLAAWAPNLLFGAGAAYLLLTVQT